jgi:V8-like Glu-specific endopeptidase
MTSWDRETLINLRETLATLYPTTADALRIAADAGLRTGAIDFVPKVITTWFNVLEYAKPRDQVENVVRRALEENPDNDTLRRALEGRPAPVIKGPETFQWGGPSSAPTLEKIMGAKSTLVPIIYLEIGLMRARAVVRVKLQDGSSGSGFIVANNMLVTNNHVLPTAEKAESAVVQFNYQQTLAGLNAPVEEARLLPNVFFRTDPADDWSAVRIEGNPVAKWGALAVGTTEIKVGDHVNIIQHPGGGPKQISLFANVVAFVGGGRVQYLTDTLPGSSGSPVFDAQWNLVALHHSGGWLTEPNATSKTTFYRNEGISIDRIVDGIKDKL